VYLRARWYAPGQGRFVSEDPFAGFATRPYSLHAYQYAYSNPVRWTDPSGAYPHLPDYATIFTRQETPALQTRAAEIINTFTTVRSQEAAAYVGICTGAAAAVSVAVTAPVTASAAIVGYVTGGTFVASGTAAVLGVPDAIGFDPYGTKDVIDTFTVLHTYLQEYHNTVPPDDLNSRLALWLWSEEILGPSFTGSFDTQPGFSLVIRWGTDDTIQRYRTADTTRLVSIAEKTYTALKPAWGPK
jgi:hypothetical protein